MHYLVYVSSAVKPFSHAELLDLMAQSSTNNGKLGITGMLLYKDGNIMQVLEGEAVAVQTLYAHIASDPRHRGLITLVEGTRAERDFPDWSMGFRDLNSAETRSMPAFSEFLNSPLTGAEFAGDPSRSHKLLLTFKRSR
jgi:Sensors of blue-light using FAD